MEPKINIIVEIQYNDKHMYFTFFPHEYTMEHSLPSKNKHEIKLNSVQNSKIQSTIKILFLYNKS